MLIKTCCWYKKYYFVYIYPYSDNPDLNFDHTQITISVNHYNVTSMGNQMPSFFRQHLHVAIFTWCYSTFYNDFMLDENVHLSNCSYNFLLPFMLLHKASNHVTIRLSSELTRKYSQNFTDTYIRVTILLMHQIFFWDLV